MKTQSDFKKDWPKLRRQLVSFSKEALDLAKKGEKELVRISKQVSKKGRLHVDSTALNLKKEHLYHLIGKEYIKAKCPGPQSVQLKKLVSDVARIDKQIQALKTRMKATPLKKKKQARKRV